MLSASDAFRAFVDAGGHLQTEIIITFANGTTQTLDGSALTMGGLSVSASTSGAGRFDIGSAIVGSAELTLANYDGEWDDADFTDATCVISVGALLENGTTEWLRKGVYGISQPESYDSTITLQLHDNMRLFERDYADVSTTYPTTLGTIVRDICTTCGVTMLSQSFPRDAQSVQVRPEESRTTCLDVLAWAAQMAGCFADMDPWGRLRVRWYDTGAFEAQDSAARVKSIDQIKSLTTVTDDVVITGVEVTASDERRPDGTQGASGETYRYGSAGYVLKVEGNPLIGRGYARAVAQTIGPAIVGMRFRPLTLSALGDPTVEAGDPLLVTDRRGRVYQSWATNTTWKHGGYQTYSCDAETPARNKAQRYSAMTRAIVQQRNAARAERTVREQAISNLAQQLADSGGLYKTEVLQQDGSTIYYLHDKPTLAESTIIWKLTSQAFAISTDGGQTYPFGFDAWGNAILQALYAIGIDAEYVTLDNKTLPDVVDDARKVATDYINDDPNDAWTDFGSTISASKLRLLPSGMELFDGNGDSVALYGTDARIGRVGDGYVLISHNAMVLFDMYGVPYMRIQDRRNEDGLYVYESTYKGDATAQVKWRHSFLEVPEQGDVPVPIYAELDGVEIPFVTYSTSGTGYPTTLGVFAAVRWYLGYANVVTYNRTSSSSYESYDLSPDETVFVRFACECDLAKDYTIGTRAVGEDVGIGSIVMGHNCSATKRRTIAIGTSPDATAQDAMAIGTDASASGQYSVAIGDGATTMGTNGVAIGHGAVAGGTSDNGYHVNIADRIMFDGYGKPYFSHDRDISVATTVLTTNSLFTFTNFRFVRSGRVAMLSFDWSYSFTISVPATGNITDLQIGTLREGFRPATIAHPVSNGNGVGPAWYHISTGGALILCAVEGTGTAQTIAANTTFNFACTYITE